MLSHSFLEALVSFSRIFLIWISCYGITVCYIVQDANNFETNPHVTLILRILSNEIIIISKLKFYKQVLSFFFVFKMFFIKKYIKKKIYILKNYFLSQHIKISKILKIY